jgi:hypothetical protein
LLINGLAGPFHQPDAEPAWGMTTNRCIHSVKVAKSLNGSGIKNVAEQLNLVF